MATVTGYDAETTLGMFNESVTQAEYNAGTGVLTLKDRENNVVLSANVKGGTGPTGPAGPAGAVAAGGYVGTLQDALDDAKAWSDLAGKGLVAYDDYAATDITKSGGDDTFHTVDNISLTYNFVLGRSYRIDFGIHVQFQALSTDAQVISLDLREDINTLRRATIPGDTEGHTSGVGGSHIIKSCPWSGNKTLNLRFQKRTGSNVTINNTSVPSFVSVTDLGGRFV